MRLIKRNVSFLLIIATIYSCLEKKQTTDDSLTPTKPNIIVIVTDDQGYGDLGHHGNPWIKTPHLDRFAKTHLELTNFHVGTTCAPTRAGLITGRNANRNNAWHTIAGCSILLEDEETIAEIFKNNGYETAMFGKWHLGDNYPFRPQDRGFNYTLHHGGGGVGQTSDYWNNNYFDDTYFRNGTSEKFKGYCTDVWFNEAINYIDKKGKEPFFMYLATNAAHGPFNVPEEYAKMYDQDPLTDKQKRFYGMISNIDDNFGKLITYLKKEDLFNNTILIFTTDNGTAAGITNFKNDAKQLGYNANLRGTKGSHYDGGHRVPFFMSWPNGNIQKKTAINELIAHVDLLPTLTDLSGITHVSKKPLDGTSVSKILTGEQKEIDRMLVVDTQRNQLPEKGRNSCVMSAEWRLVNGNELYNLKNDQGQKNNIADAYPEVVKKMQTFYDDWWTSILPDITYAEIPLGHPKANPVSITVHDMHTEDNLPWNQTQIREGKLNPEGYYSIKIIEDGEYEFKLYRYPIESQLYLNATAESISNTPYIDGLPSGKNFSIESGFVKIGDASFKAKALNNQSFILIKGVFNKGSYQLKSKFILSNEDEIPAYYTQIKKL